jgi:hypothetical protein
MSVNARFEGFCPPPLTHQEPPQIECTGRCGQMKVHFFFCSSVVNYSQPSFLKAFASSHHPSDSVGVQRCAVFIYLYYYLILTTITLKTSANACFRGYFPINQCQNKHSHSFRGYPLIHRHMKVPFFFLLHCN